MAHFEKELDRKEIYRGRIFTVSAHRIETEAGEEALREVVEHHGGACVLARDPEGRVLLVRQYRFAAGKELADWLAQSCHVRAELLPLPRDDRAGREAARRLMG